MVLLLPVRGLPLIHNGDDLPALVLAALEREGERIEAGDVLVLAQKIVSKAERRVVALSQVCPSERAHALAQQTAKDPRLVELILQESAEIVRSRPGLIVVEDRRGFVCANAGIDRSNIEQEGSEETVALLPLDPDASARSIREGIAALTGREIAVIINDSHGRAWRQGTVGVAIGVAGLAPLWDRRGDPDLTGYVLQHTIIGVADEIAAAASLLMGPAAEGIPAVVVRGLSLPPGDGTARDIQRPRESDLFR